MIEEDVEKAKEEYFQNGAISAREVIWSLQGIKDFNIGTLCKLIEKNKSNICIYDEMYSMDGYWRIGFDEGPGKTIDDWAHENPTAKIIERYHKCERSTDIYKVWLDKYYVFAKEDTDKLVSRIINEKYSVISLIDQYNAKVDKKNCHITNKEMEIMQKILSKALEVELNVAMKAFNEGKISKLHFSRYADKYKVATEKLLPNMVKNWMEQESRREEIAKRVNEAKQKVQRKAEAALKIKEENMAKREALKAARLAKKEELKRLKAEKLAEREKRAEAKRKESAADKLKKESKEL